MKTIKFVAAILSGCGISGWTILAVIASAVEAANPNSGLPTEPITPPAEYAQAADAADAAARALASLRSRINSSTRCADNERFMRLLRFLPIILRGGRGVRHPLLLLLGKLISTGRMDATAPMTDNDHSPP